MGYYLTLSSKPNRLINVSLLILGLLILFPTHAYAYIDPGTSGFVFSFLGQILAVLAVFLGVFFRPIIRFFKYIFQKIKQYPKLSIPILTGIILIAGIGGYRLLSPLLSNDEENIPMQESQGKKVLFLGMDGLDAKIMERLMDAGELPHFSRLRETGSYSPLQTSNPSQSPVAWSSLATGCNPGKHGIFDFIKRDPQTYLPDLAILKFKKGALSSSMYSPVRQATAFWEITAAAGIPSTVLRWPITFPPKQSKAKVFAGLGVPDIRGSLGNYAFYTTQPVAPDDDGKHKVIVVTPSSGTINTEIIGPPVAGIKKKTANIPLNITLDKTNKQATIKVGGQTIVLQEKTWSDWVELKFKLGFMQKVRGIAKFYLTQVEPLKLYLSPIEVHPRQPVFKITNPDEYAEELAEQIGLYHTLGMPEDTKALTEHRFDEDAFLESCKEIMLEREKMLMYELSRFNQGLLAFVFDTTDRIQHMFWRFEKPDLFEPDKAAYEKYKDVVEDYYRWMDKILGTVLEKYVDHNTTQIVCSDHGFSSFRRAVHVNSWLAENGYMNLSSTTEAQRKDNTLFSDVNWNSTKAYALGFGSIYLNLKGREKQGIVSPDEARALGKEIAQKMLELTDPLTGIKVVKRVYLRDEIYSGPYLNDSPDLVIGFRPGYRVSWQTAIGGAPMGLFADNFKAWSGDHCVDPELVPGILFVNRKLHTTNPSLIDIAPTVLDILGLAIPQEMDGKSLFGG